MVLARRRPHALGTTQSEGWGSRSGGGLALMPSISGPTVSSSFTGMSMFARAPKVRALASVLGRPCSPGFMTRRAVA